MTITNRIARLNNLLDAYSYQVLRHANGRIAGIISPLSMRDDEELGTITEAVDEIFSAELGGEFASSYTPAEAVVAMTEALACARLVGVEDYRLRDGENHLASLVEDAAEAF